MVTRRRNLPEGAGTSGPPRGETRGKGKAREPIEPGKHQQQSKECGEAQEQDDPPCPKRRPDPTKQANDKAPGEEQDEIGDRYHPGEVPADLQRASVSTSPGIDCVRKPDRARAAR